MGFNGKPWTAGRCGPTRPPLAPVWQDRLELLCRLTVRTSLILQLFGLNKAAEYQIKAAVDRCYADRGLAPPVRPRGQAASFGSEAFLKSTAERYDAAYLLALHAPQGPATLRQAEPDLGRDLDKRIETYLQFLTNLYPDQLTGQASFETFCELLKGFRLGAMEMHTCKECGARHPAPVTRLSTPVCPVCCLLNPRISALRADFERRIAQQGERRRNREAERARPWSLSRQDCRVDQTEL